MLSQNFITKILYQHFKVTHKIRKLFKGWFCYICKRLWLLKPKTDSWVWDLFLHWMKIKQIFISTYKSLKRLLWFLGKVEIQF